MIFSLRECTSSGNVYFLEIDGTRVPLNCNDSFSNLLCQVLGGDNFNYLLHVYLAR